MERDQVDEEMGATKVVSQVGLSRDEEIYSNAGDHDSEDHRADTTTRSRWMLMAFILIPRSSIREYARPWSHLEDAPCVR
jgi:hypothetical protein